MFACAAAVKRWRLNPPELLAGLLELAAEPEESRQAVRLQQVDVPQAGLPLPEQELRLQGEPVLLREAEQPLLQQAGARQTRGGQRCLA